MHLWWKEIVLCLIFLISSKCLKTLMSRPAFMKLSEVLVGNLLCIKLNKVGINWSIISSFSGGHSADGAAGGWGLWRLGVSQGERHLHRQVPETNTTMLHHKLYQVNKNHKQNEDMVKYACNLLSQTNIKWPLLTLLTTPNSYFYLIYPP